MKEKEVKVYMNNGKTKEDNGRNKYNTTIANNHNYSSKTDDYQVSYKNNKQM